MLIVLYMLLHIETCMSFKYIYNETSVMITLQFNTFKKKKKKKIYIYIYIYI